MDFRSKACPRNLKRGTAGMTERKKCKPLRPLVKPKAAILFWDSGVDSFAQGFRAKALSYLKIRASALYGLYVRAKALSYKRPRFYSLCFTRLSTTAGSARVEISPKSLQSP